MSYEDDLINYTHRADRTDVNGKLTSMVGQWMRSDLSASWESVAAALNKTPGYGPATASRFRRAYELSGEKWTVCISLVCS